MIDLLHKFLLVLLFGLPTRYVVSQPGGKVISDLNNKEYQVDLYITRMQHQMLLYNGPEYVWAYPKSIGHPFFVSDSFHRSTISYRGNLYKDVSMAYEAVQDEVIIEGYKGARIRLNKESVDSFVVHGHLFVRLDTVKGETGSGFFERLYKNDIEVLIKHQKISKRGFHAEDPFVFTEANRYLIKKDHQYYEVDEAEDLLNILSGKKKVLKDYIRSNGLNFKKNPIEFLVKVSEYYSKIN